MITSYPRKFFSLLEKDAIKREKPLLTRANCYVTLGKWKSLPPASKMRYFSWLIEEGEAKNKPVAKEKAMAKLENFFFMNYDIYLEVRKGLKKDKHLVGIFMKIYIHFLKILINHINRIMKEL